MTNQNIVEAVMSFARTFGRDSCMFQVTMRTLMNLGGGRGFRRGGRDSSDLGESGGSA